MEKKEDLSRLASKLKEVTKKRIEYLLSKTFVLDKELYDVVKFFFKEFFGKDYEFCVEEIRNELNKVYLKDDTKQKLVAFLEKIEPIEHSDEEFSQEEIRELLVEFGRVADELLRAYEKERKKGFIEKFLEKIGLKRSDAEHESVFDQQAKPVEKRANRRVGRATRHAVSSRQGAALPFAAKKKLRKKRGQVSGKEEDEVSKKIDSMLEKIHEHLAGQDVHNARKVYLELVDVYENLEKKHQRRHYRKIKEAYRKLASA
jgi:hypothetical protein